MDLDQYQGPTCVCLTYKENFTDFNGYFLIPSYLNKFNSHERVKEINNYIGLECFKLIVPLLQLKG